MSRTAPAPRQTGPLSADEVARYARDGQVTPAWRLPAALLGRVRASLDRLLAARVDVRPDFIPLPHTPWAGPDGIDIAREFFGYATDPSLLDMGRVSQRVSLDFKERPIWLLRGVDRSGLNDFVTGHTHW